MNNNTSDKDKKDWEEFLSKNDKIPNKDYNSNTKKSFKIRTLDLHGYSLDKANKKVKDFIFESFNNQVRKLIIVTGKGLHSNNEKDPYRSEKLGILRYSVPEFIKSDNELMKIIYETKEANIEDGGQGAIYIFLKKL